MTFYIDNDYNIDFGFGIWFWLVLARESSNDDSLAQNYSLADMNPSNSKLDFGSVIIMLWTYMI